MTSHYLPTLILLTAILTLLISIALKRNHQHAFWISGLALIGAALVQCYLIDAATLSLPLFIFNSVNAFISTSILIFIIALWSQLYQWLKLNSNSNEEFYLLVLTLAIGATSLTSSQHFASFFISLEIMSLSFVGMIAYSKTDSSNHEAGVKYLVLSAVASALILMGMALIYLQTGSLSFETVFTGNIHQTNIASLSPTTLMAFEGGQLLLPIGGTFIFIGLCFKLSLVPCHLWVADIFEGAPLPSTALLAIISKFAAFIVLWRLFSFAQWQQYHTLVDSITLVAVCSMLMGNLLALQQQRIMRILAFSSISHFGYLLIILLLVNHDVNLLNDDIFTTEAMLFYLLAYLITLTGTFLILMQLGAKSSISQLTGLFWLQPLQASCLSLLMLSLAGIPLTVGFMGKFYLITAAIAGEIWWPLSMLVVASVIGLYFYLRVVVIMFYQPSASAHLSPLILKDKLTSWMIIATIVGIGTFPGAFAEVLKRVTH
ncbi:NADH-quinone oxidoreductase subunit N [Shewanella sp. UCD-KL12]|uniref:NADH-quinone oxidoreductase subunit N n=1 Tax=Shewanella sp. UCD-KL12 TaxID=1917163 RepID=UPI000970699B|nr:NADH-quinone oxidoreductase subunit N [Shewanella sp. UCD-KL12]